MTKIKYDLSLLNYIRIFSKIVLKEPKDCFINEDIIYFVVNNKDMGLAVGKSGSNIKTLSRKLNKNVKMISYDDDPALFVKNLIYPYKIDTIFVEGDKVVIESEDRQLKGKIIGRSGSSLAFINKVFSRYFPHKEVIVR